MSSLWPVGQSHAASTLRYWAKTAASPPKPIELAPREQQQAWIKVLPVDLPPVDVIDVRHGDLHPTRLPCPCADPTYDGQYGHRVRYFFLQGRRDFAAVAGTLWLSRAGEQYGNSPLLHLGSLLCRSSLPSLRMVIGTGTDGVGEHRISPTLRRRCAYCQRLHAYPPVCLAANAG